MAGFLNFLLDLAFAVCIISSLIPLVQNEDSKSNSKIKKLQIGIKKRIEGCEVKSKKGDVLHMHYKVLYSFSDLNVKLYMCVCVCNIKKGENII